MIHTDDIEEALERGLAGAMRDLEEAFRALVGYPQEDEIFGVRDAEHLYGLLVRVASALDGDTRVMFRETVSDIEDMVGEPDALNSFSYSVGGAVVTEYAGRWRALYRRHLSPGD